MFSAINFSTVRSLAAELYVQYYFVKKSNWPFKQNLLIWWTTCPVVFLFLRVYTKDPIVTEQDMMKSHYRHHECSFLHWQHNSGDSDGVFFIYFYCVVGLWGMVDKSLPACVVYVCVCVCVRVCVRGDQLACTQQASDLSTVCLELLAFFASAGSLTWNDMQQLMVSESMNQLNFMTVQGLFTSSPSPWDFHRTCHEHVAFDYIISTFLFCFCLFVAVLCLALSLPTSHCLKKIITKCRFHTPQVSFMS